MLDDGRRLVVFSSLAAAVIRGARREKFRGRNGRAAAGSPADPVLAEAP